MARKRFPRRVRFIHAAVRRAPARWAAVGLLGAPLVFPLDASAQAVDDDDVKSLAPVVVHGASGDTNLTVPTAQQKWSGCIVRPSTESAAGASIVHKGVTVTRFAFSIAAILACTGISAAAFAHANPTSMDTPAAHTTPAMSVDQIAKTPTATALHVSACWVRLLPAPVPSAAYFELTNSGSREAVLQAAASPAYGDVMLHVTKESGGVSSMHAAGAITLRAGGKLAFAPSGYHVMLTHPKQPLAVGDSMPLVLLFAGPMHVTTSCEVRSADTTGAN